MDSQQILSDFQLRTTTNPFENFQKYIQTFLLIFLNEHSIVLNRSQIKRQQTVSKNYRLTDNSHENRCKILKVLEIWIQAYIKNIINYKNVGCILEMQDWLDICISKSITIVRRSLKTKLTGSSQQILKNFFTKPTCCHDKIMVNVGLKGTYLKLK